jgi:biopolymer transport protein ExbB
MRKLGLLLTLLVAPWGAGAAPTDPKVRSLDDLLEQVRSQRTLEEQRHAEREVRFSAERDQQRDLLVAAEASLERERQRNAALQTTFDENELRIGELSDQIEQSSASLDELFSVVRQLSADIRPAIANSLVSTQYPARTTLLDKLTASKHVPRLSELEDLWFLMQQEMTEAGKIIEYPAAVVGADGKRSTRQVTRAGVFTIVSQGSFLRFHPGTNSLVEYSRQPTARYRDVAGTFENTPPEEIAPMVIDPSQGGILGMLVQWPDMRERISQGGIVGHIILVLAVVAALVAVQRFLALTVIERRVNRQLRQKEPRPDNPLGRVIRVYTESQHRDTESLRLKLDEAILNELPRLESGLSTLTLLAAVAPMLGLLGTVTGMIKTFQVITLFGSGDPRLMSSGISEALVTTVEGLVTAIPILLVHSMLSLKSEKLAHVLDVQSAGLIATFIESGSRASPGRP